MLYREAGQFRTTYEADGQILPIRQDRIVLLATLAIAVVAVPFIASPYLLSAILIPFLIFSLAALGLNRPRRNVATAMAPSNAFARARTLPPPSPTETASWVSRRTRGSVRPLVAAARNSSTIRRAATSSISVRALPSAMCFLARW